MNLNLSNQQALCTQIAPYMQAMKNSMDLRIPIWDRIDVERKKDWVQWDKDPIMGLAAQTVEYFVKNFPDLVAYYVSKHNEA